MKILFSKEQQDRQNISEKTYINILSPCTLQLQNLE